MAPLSLLHSTSWERCPPEGSVQETVISRGLRTAATAVI